jgi:3-oxo-5-alpha-steroid 4-dehydrogenase 1
MFEPSGNPSYDLVLQIAFAIVAVTIVAGAFVQTPYGRFADDKYGVSLDPRVGWFLMELPASVTFVWFFFQGENALAPFPLFVLFAWLVHYLNRGFLMPALMRVPKGQKSSFSLFVVAIGWVVTSLHGYLNGTWASSLSDRVGWESFALPSFVVGIAIYYGGLAVNLRSDHIVRSLRTKEEVAQGIKRYRIPSGGLFRYVSNPSYLSEIVFWLGFAIFTWSLAAVYILLITMANLVPRAIATHRWYHEQFSDYPPERKILIPLVW